MIAYAMGLGPTNPAVPTGQIPVGRDGGVTPLYTGLSSFAGVYLVGFQVPVDQADGEFQLRISINSVLSALAYLPVAR